MCIFITRVKSLIMISNKVYVKLRVPFDALVCGKELFLDPNHLIETYIDIVAEVLGRPF